MAEGIGAATVRFISAEPLLEDLGRLNLTGIDWAIASGESGPKAKRMQAVWVENILRQCARLQEPHSSSNNVGSWGEDSMKRSKRTDFSNADGRKKEYLTI